VLDLTLDAVRMQQVEEALRDNVAVPPLASGWTVSELLGLAAAAIYRAELTQLAALPDHRTASSELKEHFMGACLREVDAAVDFARDLLIRDALLGHSQVRIEWPDEEEEPTITRL
jgi:hypothetical protein